MDMLRQMGVMMSIPNHHSPLPFETFGGSSHDAAVDDGALNPVTFGIGAESLLMDESDYREPEVYEAAMLGLKAYDYLPDTPLEARKAAQQALQVSRVGCLHTPSLLGCAVYVCSLPPPAPPATPPPMPTTRRLLPPLQLSPLCPTAFNVLAATSSSLEEALELYKQAEAVGMAVSAEPERLCGDTQLARMHRWPA